MLRECTCDVLVVGSGIAGTCAALSAVEALGSEGSVMIASAGKLFSGSSFFEGTWGLGLIAPDSVEDQDDLVATILEVGCGMADEKLVHSFVEGIEPAIQRLESWGVTLKEPAAQAVAQREYIPCFDHKHRRWRGIERAPYIEAIGARLHDRGVRVFEHCDLMDILQAEDGTICGAVLFDKDAECFAHVPCKALVLATGGTGSLFGRRLTKSDCSATAQALAVNVGCELVNMEFIQFMPGIVSPVRNVVFNEKAFKYVQLSPRTIEQLGGDEEARALLDQRSGYGPFTCRLASCEIDKLVAAAGSEGLSVQLEVRADVPEFVKVYNDWLFDAFGIGCEDELDLAMYAHASNGGIRIGPQGETNVPGLFAAGECTGGMHGADRLGGLSSANGLVFGQRAGIAAAECSKGNLQKWRSFEPAWITCSSEKAAIVNERMMSTMDYWCGIVRSEEGLTACLAELAGLQRELAESTVDSESVADVAKTRSASLRLSTAKHVASAMLRRKESCGSHFLLLGASLAE